MYMRKCLIFMLNALHDMLCPCNYYILESVTATQEQVATTTGEVFVPIVRHIITDCLYTGLPSTYLYDSTSGFYYDTITGLYYDPKTQVYMYMYITVCAVFITVCMYSVLYFMLMYM